MTVRDIRESDHDDWRRLFTAFGVFFDTDFDDTVLDGVWSWLLDSEHEVSALVAVDPDDAVIGFAHYRRLADTFTAGPGWFLDDLFVDPEQRGSGAGEELMDAVTAKASEAGGGTLRWIASADNTGAQRLYDRVATRASWVTFERDIQSAPDGENPAS